MALQRSVPFFNYPAVFKLKEKEIMASLNDVLSRGAYILQKDLEIFEEAIMNFESFDDQSGDVARDRAIISTHMGLVHEFLDDFPGALTQYNHAIGLLERRLKEGNSLRDLHDLAAAYLR